MNKCFALKKVKISNFIKIQLFLFLCFKYLIYYILTILVRLNFKVNRSNNKYRCDFPVKKEPLLIFKRNK